MKVLILNNTSNYHYGCAKVMEYLHRDLVSCGHEIVDSVLGNKSTLVDTFVNIEEADAVIVNGEGTMHHDKPVPHELLNILRNAKKLGKKTALINTVWQSMTLDDEMKDVLRDTYISVREIMSAEELQKSDIDVDIHLDLSYFNEVPEKVTPQRNLIVGKFFMQKDWRPKDIPVIDIFKNDWNTIVNVLRNTEWFVTGRHHELYASCKARCPFSTLAGNTWKNEGLMKTAGVDIPVGAPHLLHSNIPNFIAKCKERRMEYEKLFNWMQTQPKFTFANKL